MFPCRMSYRNELLTQFLIDQTSLQVARIEGHLMEVRRLLHCHQQFSGCANQFPQFLHPHLQLLEMEQ